MAEVIPEGVTAEVVFLLPPRGPARTVRGVRPGAWLLLSILAAPPASAWEEAGGAVLQRRTLVHPSNPGRVPPLELHVAVGVATLVSFAECSRPEVLDFERGHPSLRVLDVGGGSLILSPSADLAPGERVPLFVSTGPGAEPLRFVLVTRRDAVDVRVQVVRAASGSDEDGVDGMARSLLDAPGAQATLDLPQRVAEIDTRNSRGQVDSVLWLGRRFFATVSARGGNKRTPPWPLAQVRMRATLPDGEVWEWPARLVSGVAGSTSQRHIATGLLPGGASGVELALDEAETPGVFQPLSRKEPSTSP
ncbi:DUF2381 family protein [Cystobacter fuscus]|uniref:DUF2381 family protein n=1 Tax=Cystobacter fuscus TaxID=43 RepID=UPI0009DCE729|nr:DUF2381 family protein [Cystobacter fuscus]